MEFTIFGKFCQRAIEMIYEIPEEIIENTKQCLHRHGCLFSCAIFPQCIAIGKKRGDGIVVKKKSYCLENCSYHYDITCQGQGMKELFLCFCPVYVEISTMNET